MNEFLTIAFDRVATLGREIAYPNIAFTPTGDEYYRVGLMPLSTSGVGVSTTDKTFGVLRIDVFVRDGAGIYSAHTLAEQAAALFPRNERIAVTGATVSIGVSHIGTGAKTNDGWFYVPVSIPISILK